jgi:hypothetical protein
MWKYVEQWLCCISFFVSLFFGVAAAGKGLPRTGRFFRFR